MNSTKAENFMRSANAPPISAGRDDGEGHLEAHEHRFRNRALQRARPLDGLASA